MGSKTMETDHRFQDAILWRFSSYTDDGMEKVDSPVALKVRWEATDREINTPDRGPIRADALVVLKIDVPLLSILRLGKISELDDPPGDLFQVQVFNKTPDIKGKNYRRTALLTKYGSSLPEITS